MQSMQESSTVLIVEDNIFNVIAFKDFLKSENIDTDKANDGLDAISMVKERH